jgi:RimJ/RimL family protein N-acetyltransferase
MDLKRSLFEEELICLAPIDPEKDAEIESKWTHDGEYLRLLQAEIARPLSPAQVKKAYESIEKKVQEDKNLFYFTIRERPGERLVGFARLYAITWSHGTGMLQLGIGDRQDRQIGYGSQALNLLLRYAFDELNLYRLTARVPEYNVGAMRFFEKAGFVLEVRRRQALNRDGRRWDLLHLGLLQDEWAQNKKPETVERGSDRWK